MAEKEDNQKETQEQEQLEVEEQEAIEKGESETNELADLKDKYLRLHADFDNFKRRNAKERLDLIQTAGKDVILDLLPIIDDFERAKKAKEQTKEDSSDQGLSLIADKMVGILKAKGLKSMESIGEDFDPELHEALTEIPAPDKKMSGKVVDEIEKGYYLNDKLIRYAKVVVGR